MIIACLKGNTANEFYTHIGGVYLKDGVYKRLNIPENIYYYENLQEFFLTESDTVKKNELDKGEIE